MLPKIYGSTARSDLSQAKSRAGPVLEWCQVAWNVIAVKGAAPSTAACCTLGKHTAPVLQLGQWFVLHTSLENRVRRIRRSAATTHADQAGGVGNRPVYALYIYIYVCVCTLSFVFVWSNTVAHCHWEAERGSSSSELAAQAEKPTQSNPLPRSIPQSCVGFCVHNKENAFLNSEQSPHTATYTYHIKLSHNFAKNQSECVSVKVFSLIFFIYNIKHNRVPENKPKRLSLFNWLSFYEKKTIKPKRKINIFKCSSLDP